MFDIPLLRLSVSNVEVSQQQLALSVVKTDPTTESPHRRVRREANTLLSSRPALGRSGVLSRDIGSSTVNWNVLDNREWRLHGYQSPILPQKCLFVVLIRASKEVIESF